MEIAGLVESRDSHLRDEAIRFAARSESIEELSNVELEALESFVSVLSERK